MNWSSWGDQLIESRNLHNHCELGQPPGLVNVGEKYHADVHASNACPDRTIHPLLENRSKRYTQEGSGIH